ncbi:hypothetical protein EDC01DRAFT_629270 [Geopyxis carbonaria]|nr:hypothetical protein EDC01DRAFT_629270 [Geopyxis carbonaria]
MNTNLFPHPAFADETVFELCVSTAGMKLDAAPGIDGYCTYYPNNTSSGGSSGTSSNYSQGWPQGNNLKAPSALSVLIVITGYNGQHISPAPAMLDAFKLLSLDGPRKCVHEMDNPNLMCLRLTHPNCTWEADPLSPPYMQRLRRLAKKERRKANLERKSGGAAIAGGNPAAERAGVKKARKKTKNRAKNEGGVADMGLGTLRIA